MAPRRGELVRPLLCVSPGDTAAWCARAGLAVVSDPSNADHAYTRVRARALLDALDGLHPGAAAHVAELAERLRDEDELLADLSAAAWERCAAGDGLAIAALAAEPEAMRRILVRRLLVRHGLGGDATSARAVRAVLAVAAGGARTQVPGATVAREAGRLVVVGPPEPPPEPVAFAVPGSVRFASALIRARHGVSAHRRSATG